MEKAPCKWVVDDMLTDLEQACICRDEAEHTASMAFSAHSLRVMLAQMDVARALLQLHAFGSNTGGEGVPCASSVQQGQGGGTRCRGA